MARRRHGGFRWEDVDFYALRPEPLLDSSRAEDGQVVLLVPRFRRGPLARWLQARLRPERAHVRVTLEERGSWLWNACDGRRSVRELVDGFRDAFPAESRQVPERVCQFLYQLAHHDFIRFNNLNEAGGRS